MNIESYRDYCLAKPGTTEHLPFDENTLVFKVMDKMFALANMVNFTSINLKCNPEWAVELRENHSAIKPGFHMSKKHWNTIVLDGSLSDKFIHELIDHSYDQVVKGLTKKKQQELLSLSR